MAGRRPTSVCLFCLSRQSRVERRRLTTSSKQRLETAAPRQEDDGFLPESQRKEQQEALTVDGSILSEKEIIRQWKLNGPEDELREALRDFDVLWKLRDSRLEVLRNLSNPWPQWQTEVRQSGRHVQKPQLRLPEANAAPIPHTVFRERVKLVSDTKAIRKILRMQLLRCQWPRDILRVVAVAMQTKIVAQNLAVLGESIIRALYRCRNNVSDPEVLTCLNTIIWRLNFEGLPVQLQLLQLGLKFAARARSLDAMKKYLKLVRATGLGMTSNVFRSVIAKFSIGHRGLGEIRNGRWRREPLLKVLKGFDDAWHLPLEEQYHLETFMDRNDWQYLHGWVAVLSRCKDSEGVWNEWELWKRSSARMRPKKLASQNKLMTTKKRGDYWFVEQITMSGDYEKAWKMFKETGVAFSTLKERVRTRLLGEGIQYSIWDDDVRDAMLKQYDTDLLKIEKAFGIRWAPASPDTDGEGSHVLVEDQEEALEKLAAGDWKSELEHGYPYGDEDVIVLEREERALHDAEESGLADE